VARSPFAAPSRADRCRDIADDAIERCQAAHDEYAAIYQSDLGATDPDIDATKQRLAYTTDLVAAVAQADLVIEAVPEIPDVKTAVYNEMAELLPTHTLIATNSSTRSSVRTSAAEAPNTYPHQRRSHKHAGFRRLGRNVNLSVCFRDEYAA
jgi:3-hydroxyacyl-CoA dehydrogenase